MRCWFAIDARKRRKLSLVAANRLLAVLLIKHRKFPSTRAPSSFDYSPMRETYRGRKPRPKASRDRFNSHEIWCPAARRVLPLWRHLATRWHQPRVKDAPSSTSAINCSRCSGWPRCLLVAAADAANCDRFDDVLILTRTRQTCFWTIVTRMRRRVRVQTGAGCLHMRLYETLSSAIFKQWVRRKPPPSRDRCGTAGCFFLSFVVNVQVAITNFSCRLWKHVFWPIFFPKA